MATEIKSRFDAVFRDSSLSFSIVSFWISEFKGGRTHTYEHMMNNVQDGQKR
jgi:hypothetical protein